MLLWLVFYQPLHYFSQPWPDHQHPPPAAPPQAALDYAALDLQPFYAGALVRYGGDFHRVADPVR